jgi:hypothetical protein
MDDPEVVVMSRSYRRALLAILAPFGAAGADDYVVALKPAMLPTPEVTISDSDAKQAGLYQGHVMTGHRLAVKTGPGGGPKDITVGAASAQIEMVGGKLEITLNGKSATFPISNLAIKQPLILTLADQRKYPVVFPLVYNYLTTCNINYRCGFVMAGKLKGKDLLLYDDNADSQFNSVDSYQSIKGSAFAPLERLVGTGDAVFELGEIAANGSSISCRDFAGATSELTIKYTGPTLHAAWRGDSGMTFTTASNSAKVTVATGSYLPIYGVTFDTKNDVCAVMIGGRAKPVAVQEKVATAFGAPFRLDFTLSVSGKTATANPYGYRLYGAQGEEYAGFEYEGVPQLLVKNGDALKQFGTFKPG